MAPRREIAIGTTVLRLQQGDLTALELDAVVFYARESLELGTGFGTAIQVRGGDAVTKELEKLAPVEPGQAAIAFPPMGAGFYGVPLDPCAKVMLETISEYLASNPPLAELVICVIDRREFAAFDKQLSSLCGAPRLCTN